MNKILISIISALLLASCDNVSKEDLKGSIDRTGKQILTTVYFYNSTEEVQSKYREIHNLPRDHKTNIQGFAQWPEFRDPNGNPIVDDTKPLTCVIHTIKPKKIDDEATLTLGHEMLHCIIGSYHTNIEK